MVDAEHDRLSITRQCRLMSIARLRTAEQH